MSGFIDVSVARDMARCVMDARAPDEVIHRDGKALFERWWLQRTPSGDAGANCYLHRWLCSDCEDPHDHPWANKTTVLDGWIEEESWISKAWLDAGGILRVVHAGQSVVRQASVIHAIIACEPGTITLFKTGQKTRDWGFWVEGRWVPWQEYHARRLPGEAAAEQVPA